SGVYVAGCFQGPLEALVIDVQPCRICVNGNPKAIQNPEEMEVPFGCGANGGTAQFGIGPPSQVIFDSRHGNYWAPQVKGRLREFRRHNVVHRRNDPFRMSMEEIEPAVRKPGFLPLIVLLLQDKLGQVREGTDKLFIRPDQGQVQVVQALNLRGGCRVIVEVQRGDDPMLDVDLGQRSKQILYECDDLQVGMLVDREAPHVMQGISNYIVVEFGHQYWRVGADEDDIIGARFPNIG